MARLVGSDRTPCINPRCRRTAPRDKFPGEMICGKCFRSLPAPARNRHRRFWREIRKWNRRIARTGDAFRRERMEAIRRGWINRLCWHWDTVLKPMVTNPSKPEGLDGFLAEVGL
ncbi:MAG: hypothetical protein QM576_02850 [Rhodopseudomonas sp.]|uniref:hypothetical protein n=1 Tax=Rhodopseudomonas sp. TaxID=1078 RepID=UPI0039E27C9C